MNRVSARALQSRLKIQYLQVVALLDETQSVTKAAERLHITRAALSKTLAALEDMLGVKLYSRTATGMSPTLYGTALARHARLILGGINSAEDEIFDLLNDERERITVGAFFVSMPVLLPRAIALLARSYPRCLVTVREGDMFELVAGLRDGEFDVIVGRILPEYFHSSVAVAALYEEKLFAVCRAGHPLANAAHLTWPEAVEFPWVLPPKESPVHRALREQLQAEGVPGPKVVIEALSIPLTVGLLNTCDAIGLMPERVTLEEQRRSQIAVLPLTIPPLPAPMGAAWRNDRALSPLASELIEALKACAPA
jgi:DNA-binding transcriptional LysR family regulator